MWRKWASPWQRETLWRVAGHFHLAQWFRASGWMSLSEWNNGRHGKDKPWTGAGVMNADVWDWIQGHSANRTGLHINRSNQHIQAFYENKHWEFGDLFFYHCVEAWMAEKHISRCQYYHLRLYWTPSSKWRCLLGQGWQLGHFAFPLRTPPCTVILTKWKWSYPWHFAKPSHVEASKYKYLITPCFFLCVWISSETPW